MKVEVLPGENLDLNLLPSHLCLGHFSSLSPISLLFCSPFSHQAYLSEGQTWLVSSWITKFTAQIFLSPPILQKQYPLLSTISKLLSCSLHDLGHEHLHCILVWPHLLLSPSFPSSLSVFRACSLHLSALSSSALQRAWHVTALQE